MVMALGGVVMTKVAADFGLPAPVAIACGIAVTTLFGLLNGLLVTRIKLPPFIVTLGTLNIAFAITQLYSGSQTITDIPAGMTALGETAPTRPKVPGYERPSHRLTRPPSDEPHTPVSAAVVFVR